MPTRQHLGHEMLAHMFTTTDKPRHNDPEGKSDLHSSSRPPFKVELCYLVSSFCFRYLLREPRNFEGRIQNNRSFRKLLSRVVRALGWECCSTTAVTEYFLPKGTIDHSLRSSFVPSLQAYTLVLYGQTALPIRQRRERCFSPLVGGTGALA